ncbi:MAG: ROK family protein [Actinomycetota bacterium]
MARPIAAIDVGGSSVKRGVVHLPDGVDETATVTIDARADRALLLDALTGAAADLLDGRPDLADLAVAFPDPFDYVAGVPLLRGLGKFESLFGVELGDELRSRLPSVRRLSFCHDAEAAGVGEAAVGAGAKHRRVLAITLGTGFGSALVVDGRPVTELDGIVTRHLYDEPVRSLGRADDVLSARGLGRRLRADPARVETGTSDEVFVRFGIDLGRFVQEWARRWAVDIVVVGGGGAAAFDRFAPGLRAATAVTVVRAELGTAAALIGAATLHADAAG